MVLRAWRVMRGQPNEGQEKSKRFVYMTSLMQISIMVHVYATDK